MTIASTVPSSEIIGVYLGIDVGTQGLTVLALDESLQQVLAKGERSYDCLDNLAAGQYEQRPSDWEDALSGSLAQVHSILPENHKILGIGLSGQMHGHVLVNDANELAVATARLWCDARNEKEAQELSELFEFKVPKRCTIARWLWTIRNISDKEILQKVDHLTTPAGWLHLKLTGQRSMGIGDASGMFPILDGRNYDDTMLKQFDELTSGGEKLKPIAQLLPKVVLAGKDAGRVSKEACQKFVGLSEGIPVAGPEGDQPAALAGSLIGRPGLISCSFGTSVCANVVGLGSGEKKSSSAVDLFCSADGKQIYMIWLRNGTTFLNSIVESYGSFEACMPLLLQAPPDCGGLISMPFMDDEPGLGISEGGTSMIMGWNPTNCKSPGNACKAALLATMFNLKKGLETLLNQHPSQTLTEIILTGGLTKTPQCGQILADVMSLPVRLLTASDEGCSFGAAVLAKYRATYLTTDDSTMVDWPVFLESFMKPASSDSQSFLPDAQQVPLYQRQYERYMRLLTMQPQLQLV